MRNVNYVVTLDKLSPELLTAIVKHRGAPTQVEEWQELGLVDEKFSIADLDKGQGELGLENSGPINGDYRFFPLDTKHFKELEQEILDSLGNLDEMLGRRTHTQRELAGVEYAAKAVQGESEVYLY